MTFIKRISLSGFKSFSCQNPQQVEFLNGLNCVVGANGSGKSNLFDAICLALTLEVKNLRVSSVKDLICSQGLNSESMASIKISIAKKSQNTKKEELNELTVQMKKDNPNRIFLLNGRAISIRGLRKFLLSLGIRVYGSSIPGFVILQNRVTTLMMRNPVEIANLVTDASGGLQFYECVKRCRSQIDTAKETQTKMKHEIDLLSMGMMEDLVTLEKWKELGKIKHSIREHKNALQYLKLQETEINREKKKQEIKEIEESLDQVRAEVLMVEKRLNDTKTQLENLERSSTSKQIIQYESCLEEKKMERRILEKKIIAFRDSSSKRESLIQEKEAVEKDVVRLNARKGKLTALLYSHCDDLHLLLTRKKQCLTEVIESIQEEESRNGRIQHDYEEMKRLVSQLSKSLSNRKLDGISTEATLKESMIENDSTCKSLQIDLEEIRNECYLIEKSIEKLREYTIKGVYGPVGLLFSPKTEEMELPLSLIAKPFERSLVVENSSTVSSVIDLAKKKNWSVTLWPLDRLDVSHAKSLRDRVKHIQLSDPLCSSTIHHPMDCISFDDTVHDAILKCLGSLVITENDEVSQYLLKRYHLNSITKAGNVYRSCSISGGYQSPGCSLPLLLSTVTKLNQRETILQDKICQMRKQKELLERDLVLWKETYSLQEKLKSFQERESRLEIDLSESASRVDELQKEKRIIEEDMEILNLGGNLHDNSFTSEQSLTDCLMQVEAELSSKVLILERTKDILEDIEDQKIELNHLGSALQVLDTMISELTQTIEELSSKSQHIVELEEKLAHHQNTLTSHKSVEKEEQKRLSKLNHALRQLEMERKQIPNQTPSESPTLSSVSREELLLRIQKLEKKQNDINLNLPVVDQQLLETKQNQLAELQRKYDQIHHSIQQLLDGIDCATQIVDQCNVNAFEFINQQFTKYFQMVFPRMVSKLEKQGNKIEQGIKFVIFSANDMFNPIDISQLSGGQKTLLSLCFMLAIASYSKSPFYLMDEIDAALDEENQRAIASLIKQVLSDGVQILSISHNHAFQSEANRTIHIQKSTTNNHFSEITKVVTHITKN